MMKTITAGQVMREFPLPMMTLALILVLGAFGCSPAAAPGGGGGGALPDKVIVGLGDDVPIFSSVRARGANNRYITANVYEGLTTMDPDGKVLPGLAVSWKVSPD